MSARPARRGDSDPTFDAVLASDPDAVRAEARAMVARFLVRPSWHTDAACLGEPTEVFFPGRGQSTAAALALCRRCPVADACLAEALDDPDLEHGIRGGLTAPERRRLRVERARGAG